MRTTILTLFSVSLLFCFGSCDQMASRCVDPDHCPARGTPKKQQQQQQERQQRRW